MDDDLRNRFRSTRRSFDGPSPARRQVSARPVTPTPQPAVQPQQPVAPQRQVAQPQPQVLHSAVPQQPVMTAQPQPARTVAPRRSGDVMSPGKSRPRPMHQTPRPANKPTVQPKSRKKTAKPRRRNIRRIAIILILLGVACAAGYVVWQKRQPKTAPAVQQNAPSQQQATQPSGPTGTIRLIATGDNLAFESINNAAKTATGYDYAPMMSAFKPLFDKADIRLCNQTTPAGGEALGVSGFPEFNAPTAWSTGLAATGCNLINLGSDHMNDKGQAAIDATINTWDSQPGVLAYAGANKSAEEQAEIRYFTINQVKFAYLSYTTKSQKPDHTPFGINVYSPELAKTQIETARKNANLVLVSMTWGNDDQTDITPDQDRIALELALFGADVVIGTGTHVLQPAKVIDGAEGRQTLVWFGLGNFLNSQLPVNNLIGGMAIMDFDAATKKLINPKLLPVYMHYEWTPQQKASNNVNARTNFKVLPLDQATEALAASQNGTTVADQTARVTGIITQFAPIKVITTADY